MARKRTTSASDDPEESDATAATPVRRPSLDLLSPVHIVELASQPSAKRARVSPAEHSAASVEQSDDEGQGVLAEVDEEEASDMDDDDDDDDADINARTQAEFDSTQSNQKAVRPVLFSPSLLRRCRIRSLSRACVRSAH
jgi:TATA-binding protein-associated factor Taf7